MSIIIIYFFNFDVIVVVIIIIIINFKPGSLVDGQSTMHICEEKHLKTIYTLLQNLLQNMHIYDLSNISSQFAWFMR